MEVYNKFKSFLQKEELFKKDDRFLLGVSGGPDSLTMLDLFLKLKSEVNLKLAVFHLNHLFRTEASAEAEFVKNLCDNYNVECYIEEFDVPFFAKRNSLSPEQAAREIRMNFLFERAKKLGIKKIALAHNKNDLVETVFLNIIRGCGLSGLSGIEPKTFIQGLIIIHPLLKIRREEIEDYCVKENLNPRHDKSNQKTIYTRNKIRHEVIPYIEKEINPSLKDVVERMANLVKEENDYLKTVTENKLLEALLEKDENKIVLSLSKLNDYHKVIKRRVIFEAIYKLKENNSDIYFKHYQEIKKLFKKGATAKKIDLPGKIKVKRVYDKLIIKKGNFKSEIDNYCFDIEIGTTIKLPDNNKFKSKIIDIYENWQKNAIKPSKCLIDVDKIKFPLKVRNRRNGDKFKPLGLNGFKKIKDFFIDEKIEKNSRDKIPIIVDSSGIIVWIAGLRMDDRVKITETTSKIIELTLIKKEDKNE